MCNILQYKSVKIIPFTPITDIKLCPTATGSFKGKFLYYWEDLLTPSVTCKDYLQEGLCRKNNCRERHPKSCKYWTKTPGGCPRLGKCLYLHEDTEKYAANVNGDELLTSENNEQVYDCDDCESNLHNKSDPRAHGETSQSQSHNCQECEHKSENTRLLESHRKEKSTNVNKDVNKEWLDEIIRKYGNM